jgi:flagellar motor switch protein FliM
VNLLSAEVLSQNEIDALLAALSTGEMSPEEMKKDFTEKKVKLYDFKRALRFSKDQIRTLTRIHENFARLLTTYFSAQLRTLVRFTVASVDQLPYDEFIRSVPKMTILNVFEAEPLEGRMVLEVNPNVAYAILDRLLGGQGVSQAKFNGLTEIETIVLERVFRRCLKIFAEAWKTVLPIDPELMMLEINSQFLQIVSPNETVAVVSFSTKIAETTGVINVCLPHVVLEPVLVKLSAHHWLSTQKKARDKKEVEAIQQNVRKAMLPIIAELGTSSISVREFLSLTSGDIIQMDTKTKQSLQVKVGSKLKFTGRPGTKSGKIAIQIDNVIDEGVEENER